MTTEPTKPDAKADAVATKPAAAPAPKAPKVATIAPVIATKRINGEIMPGDIIVPKSVAERTELVDTLDAARDLSDAELALFEKTGGAAVDEDPIG